MGTWIVGEGFTPLYTPLAGWPLIGLSLLLFVQIITGRMRETLRRNVGEGRPIGVLLGLTSVLGAAGVVSGISLLIQSGSLFLVGLILVVLIGIPFRILSGPRASQP